MRRSDTTAGQRHREREAARRREHSRKVREISPIPAMKNPLRRMKARKCLKTFCEQYFPKRFKLAWSSYHLEVIKRLQDILIQGGGKLALAMPRGSGKTTLIETAIIWAVLFGHCRFIVAIGANKEESKKIINNIKAALTENKELLADFPETIYPFHKLNGSALLARGQLYLGELTGIEWKPDMVVFARIPGSLACGAVIVSVGIHGAIRGKNRTMPDGSVARPDAIILDDVATQKDANSPAGTKKIIQVIDSDISGLVGPADEMAMFMACTVIADGDVASTYLDRKLRPQWNGLRYKMVEEMPEAMDLWQKYAEIRGNDPVAATMFYRKNRKAMQKGAVVAWEANYTGNELDALQYAMNKWADNEAAFRSEYQNDPMPPDAGAAVVPGRAQNQQLGRNHWCDHGLYQESPGDAVFPGDTGPPEHLRNAYGHRLADLPKIGWRKPGEFAEHFSPVLKTALVKCAHLDASWSMDHALATQSDWGKEHAYALQTLTHLNSAFFSLARQIWYGTNNVLASSDGFPGLFQLIGSTAPNASNADLHIDAGGTGTGLSSVFAVSTGIDTIQLAWGSEGQLTEGQIQITPFNKTDTTGKITHAHYASQQIEGWCGLQVTSAYAFGRIKNLSPAKPLNDNHLFDLISRFPVGREPSAFFMSRRSLEQLRKSRTATNATGAPAPTPTEVAGVPIHVTDAIANNEEVLV